MDIEISLMSFTLTVPILIATIFSQVLPTITEIWSHLSNITSPPCNLSVPAGCSHVEIHHSWP